MKDVLRKIMIIFMVGFPGIIVILGIMGFADVFKISPDFAHFIFIVLGMMTVILSLFQFVLKDINLKDIFLRKKSSPE